MYYVFNIIYIIINFINSVFYIMQIEPFFFTRFIGESTVFFSYIPLNGPAADMYQIAEWGVGNEKIY